MTPGFGEGEEDTAVASLNYRVSLEQADQSVLGWQQLVLRELDRMRSEMPYADELVLRLECIRRPE